MIYWIDALAPGRLGIMARPRANDWLEDEVARWREERVGHVVSLLEDGEIAELGLEAEGDACARAGIRFERFPIADRDVPASGARALEVCRRLKALVDQGDAVAIHCRAGIGRSSLMAATVLRLTGLEAEAAFDAISTARGLRVPDTSVQVDWLKNLDPAEKDPFG